MLRNCLAAGLRHLRHHRLYSAISVVGLAIGLCTALLAALVIHNQYTFNHDIPAYARTYALVMRFAPPGAAPQYVPTTSREFAAQLKEASASVSATTRLFDTSSTVVRGSEKGRVQIFWADPNLFEVLPRQILAGNASAALHAADGLVLSQACALRFFGVAAPLGRTLLIDGHPMVVQAVMADTLPQGSKPPDALGAAERPPDIIAAGVNSFSPLNPARPLPDRVGPISFGDGTTFVQLKPGAGLAALSPVLPQLVRGQSMLDIQAIRIDRLNTNEEMHPGFRVRMQLIGILGLVVLLVACVNFVNLQTAHAGLRAREVAIRAVAGASRPLLIIQFLVEAVLYTSLAAVLAVALAEWLLPHVNAALNASAQLDFIHDPWLAFLMLACVLLLGVISGAWPAALQSRFRPAEALRRRGVTLVGGSRARQVLVAVQFGLLITLAIGAEVVYLQREFAMREGLRVNSDQVLMVYAPNGGAFFDLVRTVPGVRAATRASVPFLGSAGFEGLRGVSLTLTQTKAGADITLLVIKADFNLFDFYGIKPLVGRLPTSREPPETDYNAAVINETAARKLGFALNPGALGQQLPVGSPDRPGASEQPGSSWLAAIVPDFSLSPVTEIIPPTIYFQSREAPDLISLRLVGHDLPETLAAIDALWRRSGHDEPPKRFFLNQQMQLQYLGVLRQSEAFGLCALLAVCLSCIGLLALTAAAVERRTKEIGIRKSLGAGTRDVLQLLLWQFSRPVLWAVALAWPVAAVTMSRWLAGFAYHIAMPLWMFPVAAIATLLIALATVSLQSIQAARVKPITALRYE